MDRLLVALDWQERAKLSRAQIFGTLDNKLRPTAMPSQVDVAVPGMVGGNYEEGGVAIMSVNPAGGRDGFLPTAGDASLYEAAVALGAGGGPNAFERLNAAFVAGMPHWGPQWRVVSSILEATRQPLSSIAYPYLVPFRSRGDAGSKLPRAVLDRSYDAGLTSILDRLAPRHLIAVDRPSEWACHRWNNGARKKATVTYLTRKRDAHSDRRATLERLSLEMM